MKMTCASPQACEFGRNPYYAEKFGDNVWEYWFQQPGRYKLGAGFIDEMPIQAVQVTAVELIAHAPVRVYGTELHRLQSRVSANRMLGTNGTRLIRSEIREAASRSFAPWRSRSQHIIGVHLRGTDKVVQPKVCAISATGCKMIPLKPQIMARLADAMSRCHPRRTSQFWMHS